MDAGDFQSYQVQGNSEYGNRKQERTVPGCEGPGTRGKQPRSCAKALKEKLSDKGFDRAVTAKRWAWKQPSFRESVTAQWSRPFNPKMDRDSSFSAEAANPAGW